jgi:hypothetical protein
MRWRTIAMAMAPSVPGSGRSQRSAISAAWVRKGSITMIFPPRACIFFTSIHCGGSAWAGLRPTMSRQLEVSTSSPPWMPRPVTLSLTPRQPPQRSWLIIQLGEPIERISRAMIGPRLKAAPLTAPTSDFGPYLPRTSAMRVAISSSADSQLTCSHWPEPRGPTRRNGWRRRVSW